MHTYWLLLAETALSVLISLAVLTVLARPLVDVLARICPDERAALFWVKYTKVMLVIAPLLLVLAVDLLAHNQEPVTVLRLAIMAALCGVLLGLHVLGKRLSRFEVTAHR